VAFRVHKESCKTSSGRDPTIWVLEGDNSSRLEVWPALGFNAYRWQVGGEDILYRDPAFFDDAKPTRSGWPILFPFPNRIRDGRFSWEGKSYELPTNDPSGKNAIHGFVHSRPWRVVDRGANRLQTWVTGEFESSWQGMEVSKLWPGEYSLRTTYRLGESSLRCEVIVTNPGPEPLPFGIGFHPYFRCASFGGDDALVGVDAGKRWQLIDNLPTGALEPFFWAPHEKPFGEVVLDDLLTDLPLNRQDARSCGHLESQDGRRLVVEASRDYRELVVFTPPHRQAICFEPYTCITDAFNLHQRGVDTGLQVLAPGDTWLGRVLVSINDEPAPAA
jgi:aldose 1-epimerase